LAAEPVKPLVEVNELTVREEYFCDSDGNLRAKISEMSTGNTREYQIAQLAPA
jgi:hypothetical protein